MRNKPVLFEGRKLGFSFRTRLGKIDAAHAALKNGKWRHECNKNQAVRVRALRAVVCTALGRILASETSQRSKPCA